ncbi:carboxypeptidase-like regulatory domain-containing protein [Hymenobacter pini]|uniref:carboxypeptidase-like regulatory domain-containing protein n=1 Tax=Hymenobacter pini TaxID=2880879 RepID=UPI001CF350C0|nr:carboxypeptidase-like regulatory domain-containing protein [Hymenobacter pini]MCA8832874.1 carboxypeptidase-like regulatory domain-containing protein [Hymenobacter pini]
MPHALTVTIPLPCHENWADMAPTAQGRHCAACAKVVVDFTRLTDAEIVAYLSQASSRSCGRFRAEQLQRPLRITTEAPASRQWLAAALAVLGLGAATPVAAQTRSTPPQEQRMLQGEPAAPTPALPDRVIRGRVTDSRSGEGLPWITVLLKDTQVGVSTNSDGTFELRSTLAVDAPIEFFSIGYKRQTIILSGSQPLTVALVAESQRLTGEVVVVKSYRTAWCTPRGVWQRLTGLFR